MNRRYSDPLCRKKVNLELFKTLDQLMHVYCTQMLPYGLPHSTFADCKSFLRVENMDQSSPSPSKMEIRTKRASGVQGMLWARFTI